MVRRLLIPAIGSALACAVAGCTAKTNPPPVVCSAPQGGSSSAQSLASDDTAFALDFYPIAVAAAGSTKNVVLSPYGVATAMTIVDVGAAGQTESQIESVLHLEANGAAEAPAYATLACGTESDGSSNGNELLVANSLWAQQGFPFEQTFESVLENGYEAPLQQVDFESNPTGAEATTNGWVSGKTQGAIPLAPATARRRQGDAARDRQRHLLQGSVGDGVRPEPDGDAALHALGRNTGLGDDDGRNHPAARRLQRDAHGGRAAVPGRRAGDGLPLADQPGCPRRIRSRVHSDHPERSAVERIAQG